MKAEKTCEWYVEEKWDGKCVNYVRCKDEHGFCLLKDFYTKCDGKCDEYMERKRGNKTSNKHN